jgi:hypothetical protein
MLHSTRRKFGLAIAIGLVLGAMLGQVIHVSKSLAAEDAKEKHHTKAPRDLFVREQAFVVTLENGGFDDTTKVSSIHYYETLADGKHSKEPWQITDTIPLRFKSKNPKDRNDPWKIRVAIKPPKRRDPLKDGTGTGYLVICTYNTVGQPACSYIPTNTGDTPPPGYNPIPIEEVPASNPELPDPCK